MLSSSPIVAAFERQRQLQPELIDVVSDHEDENGGSEAQVLEGDVPQKRKRSLQQVSTVRDRMKIIQWMINDVNGQWHEKQLTPQLQEIIKKHQKFDGEPVPVPGQPRDDIEADEQ